SSFESTTGASVVLKMSREVKFTRQEVARILGAIARTDNKLARSFPDNPGLAESFKTRADAESFAARLFLRDDPRDPVGSWRTFAPAEIRVRGSYRAGPYTRRRPRATRRGNGGPAWLDGRPASSSAGSRFG